MSSDEFTSEYCDCAGNTPAVPAISVRVGSADDIPAPQTKFIGGADSSQSSPMPGRARAMCVAVAIVLVIVAIIALVKGARKKDKFFTRYAEENPIRQYTPYTGTVPYGDWGTKPWALAFDLETPQEEAPYLPEPYRTFEEVL